MNRAERRRQQFQRPNIKEVRIPIDSRKPMDLADRIHVFAASSQAIISLRNNHCATEYELSSLKGVTELAKIVAKACAYNALDLNPLLSLMQSIEYAGSVTEEQVDAADRALNKVQLMCARTPRYAWKLAIDELSKRVYLREAMETLERNLEQ